MLSVVVLIPLAPLKLSSNLVSLSPVNSAVGAVKFAVYLATPYSTLKSSIQPVTLLLAPSKSAPITRPLDAP